MTGGPEKRAYFLGLIRENINRCAVGRGDEEKALMWRLFRYANGTTESSFEFMQKQARLMARAAPWDRAYRQQIYDFATGALQSNLNISSLISEMLERLYYDKGCPFDALAEANYAPPVYSDARSDVGANARSDARKSLFSR